MLGRAPMAGLAALVLLVAGAAATDGGLGTEELRLRRSPHGTGAGFIPASEPDGPRFRPDDPLWRDPDDLPVETIPGEVELSTTWDVIENTFLARARRPAPTAQNINTLGEVPDSSWYENRLSVRELSAAELVRGPATSDGPADGPWTVIGGKSGGLSPGFTIRDARDEVWFVKFDDQQWPNLASAAERIGTLAFHAFGYHVPEVHLATFRREQLRIDPAATTRDRGRSTRRPLTEDDLAHALSGVAVRPDGSIRCAASRRLPGLPLGPRKHHGTRPDDPNDVVPHEHRRELRGARLFSAWLNHDDSRAPNTLDTLVTESGRRYVKHFLIDFSSALGSGSDARRRLSAQNPRAGHEYQVEFAPIWRTLLTLGLWERPWRRIPYREYPEVGRIEAVHFDPETWKPEYPNPAFDSMRPADALWAARILMRLSPEAVRTLVREGRLDDPAAEAHLVDVLLARRLKILDRYLRALNPLSDFRLERGRLAFVNLGDDLKLAAVEGYDVEWWSFDNDSGERTLVAESARFSTPSIAIPRAAHPWLLARIRTASAAERRWAKAVEVFLRRSASGFDVVGIEREESQ